MMSPADLLESIQRSTAGLKVAELLRRLHEGTLARYGLRQSEFLRWQEQVRTDV